MTPQFTPEVVAHVQRLEAAGWEVCFRYLTGFNPLWEAKKFVLRGDPLCPPIGQGQVLVQYAAGDVFQLAKTCGVEVIDTRHNGGR